MKVKSIIPVLPSRDIEKDVAWYKDYVGLKCVFSDSMYALLKGDNFEIHLQWHTDTEDDPLLGGSVVRIKVDDVKPIFQEFVKMKTVAEDKLRLNTPWNTHEFGFYDLNSNAIFIMQSLYLVLNDQLLKHLC